MNTSPIVFVTIVTGDYWPGLAALVESLRQNSGLSLNEYRFVVFGSPDARTTSWLKARAESIEVRPIDFLGSIPVKATQIQGQRMEEALRKLCIFKLPDVETAIYIDADIVCLNSIREITTFRPITAATDLFVHPGEPEKLNSHTSVNTGFMVFRPSIALFDRLLAAYSESPWDFTEKGDQDVVNHLLDGDESVTRLSSDWNLSKRHQDSLGWAGMSNLLKETKFLHFVGNKPWWPDDSIRGIYECRYFRLEKIWWSYFQQSGYSLDPVAAAGVSGAWSRQYMVPLKSRLRKETLRLWKEKVLRLSRKAWNRIPRIRNATTRIALRFVSALNTPGNHSPRPNNPNEIEQDRVKAIANVLFSKMSVLGGPFKGMHYPSLESHGSAIYPKLLGSYEFELHQAVHDIVSSTPSLVIDIGCAEGYYAVGFARALPQASVVAADASEKAQGLCRRMSDLNGVADRVKIVGLVDKGFLLGQDADAHGLLVCDCEGGESELLDPEVFHFLSRWTILIELHEFLVPGIEASLESSASATHDCRIIESIDDHRRIDRFQCEIIRNLGRREKYWLLREGRPHTMRWLVALPKKANFQGSSV